MEIATIQGETRKPGGRNVNRRLRQRGLVPAVIYGHGKAPEVAAVSLHDTVAALKKMAHVIQLKIDGRDEQYLVKEVQYDHLNQVPIHVDLMRVDLSERVHVKVPVELKGTPIGVTEGGVLVHVLADLEVECRALEIPETLRARVDHLVLNGALHVREVELPPDVKALHNPEDIVAVVHPPRGTTTAEVAASEAEGVAAEPEVITKGKEETEAEGAEK